jgi:hypothetical protein
MFGKRPERIERNACLIACVSELRNSVYTFRRYQFGSDEKHFFVINQAGVRPGHPSRHPKDSRSVVRKLGSLEDCLYII